MTRSSATSVLPPRSEEPVDEGEGEEEEEEEEEEGAEGEEEMSTQGGGSDRDSDASGDEGDDEEEEVMDVEEGEEEEDEEEDGGEEETDEGEEMEEAAGGIASEEENEDGEEEEELGEGDGGADSPQDSPAPEDEDVDDDAVQQIKCEGKGEFMEKEASAEIVNVKNDHEIVGDQQPPTTKESVNADQPGSLHLKEKELVEVTHKRCRSSDLDCIMHLENEVSDLDRCQSPTAVILENGNKRPGVVCDFFARGWCVKGNSCRFLHQKDEDDANLAAKGDFTGASVQKDSKEGLKHEADRFYTPRESLLLTAENSASESLQRALVRAYGGHEPHQFQDKDSQSLFQTDSQLGTTAGNMGVQLATSDSSSFLDRYRTTYTEGASIPGRRPFFPLSEYPQPIQAEDVKSYDASSCGEKWDSHFNSIDGGQSIPRGFIPHKYLGEGKTQHELSKMDCKRDEPFPRGSPVIKNSFITEYKHCSSTSLMPSSTYLGSSTHVNDRSTAESIGQYQGPPSVHVPTAPYFTKGLFSSSGLIPNAFHSTRDSLSLGMEDADGYKRLDYEREYQASRSTSPFSQFGPEKFGRHEIAGGTSVFEEKNVQSSRDAWEPSIPFRSSFYCPPANISSPGSQYDPLSDSIDPLQSLSNQHKSIDYAPKKSDSPGNNDLNFQTSFHKSHESIVRKSNPEHGTGGYPSSSAGVSGLGTLDGVNRISMPKEKSWSPGHLTDVGNMKDTDYEDNLRNQEDKSRHHKETKALKNFRASLVEFVKDLVKPAWREGHLSKDAHKMVVKKAAEKVLSALQPHQIPSTMDAVNQYLSASRPKIVKLVEGYVDKYAKS